MIRKVYGSMLDSRTQQSNALSTHASKVRVVPDAMLTVLSDAAKVSFRGSSAAAVAAASDAFGIELPPTSCRFIARGLRSALWLGPDEWLLQAVGEAPEELFAHLEGSLAGHPHALVDVSHRSVAFSVSGPKSEYLLNHGCPLDLSSARFPVGMCTRTLIGKAPVVLSRQDVSTFHVDVWRSFAPYVWQLLDEPRVELEGDLVWQLLDEPRVDLEGDRRTGTRGGL
jgi:sarcosine oxidase subunit gamma